MNERIFSCCLKGIVTLTKASANGKTLRITCLIGPGSQEEHPLLQLDQVLTIQKVEQVQKVIF